VKYRDSIYFYDDKSLYVNLFIPSTLRWKELGAVLTQSTNFPESPTTKIALKLDRPTDIALKLRHPRWSRTAIVLVNGKEAARSTVPSSYIELARTWQSGDVVELQLSMEVETDHAPAAPDIVAFTYGPLVLAGALGNESLAPGADIVVNEREYGKYNNTPFAAPSLTGDAHTIADRVRPGNSPLEFSVESAEKKSVRLIPYYRIAHERYATYWELKPELV
jgi:DUF1680 family protein